MKNKLAVIAIAKNESRYIEEWARYHISLGVDEIYIYDNESTDNTNEVLQRLAEEIPITVNIFKSQQGESPQRAAYNKAINALKEKYEWGIFLDIDEFLVPWEFNNINEYINTIPEDVSCVCINWRCFGSSGITAEKYKSVIKTFKRCADESWPNNCHYKSLARLNQIDQMLIHDAILKTGRRIDSKLNNIPGNSRDELTGKTSIPVYGGIQINHYQSKSYPEFQERMLRGNANFPPGHPQHKRDSSRERFNQLDRNEDICTRINKFTHEWPEKDFL